MTKEQALAILKQPGRIGCNLIKANDEESNKYNQESIEALDMAIKALEQNNEEIYKAGYEDGVHDGYYSSLIEDGTEEKHFGKSYQEQPTSDDCVSRKAVDLLCFRYLKPNNDDNVAFYKHFLGLPPITPTFPKGTTNGDIMKIIFPNIEANEVKTDTGGYIEVKYLDTTDKCDATAFRRNWWNALYKRGNSDGQY